MLLSCQLHAHSVSWKAGSTMRRVEEERQSDDDSPYPPWYFHVIHVSGESGNSARLRSRWMERTKPGQGGREVLVVTLEWFFTVRVWV